MRPIRLNELPITTFDHIAAASSEFKMSKDGSIVELKRVIEAIHAQYNQDKQAVIELVRYVRTDHHCGVCEKFETKQEILFHECYAVIHQLKEVIECLEKLTCEPDVKSDAKSYEGLDAEQEQVVHQTGMNLLKQYGSRQGINREYTRMMMKRHVTQDEDIYDEFEHRFPEFLQSFLLWFDHKEEQNILPIVQCMEYRRRANQGFLIRLIRQLNSKIDDIENKRLGKLREYYQNQNAGTAQHTDKPATDLRYISEAIETSK